MFIKDGQFFNIHAAHTFGGFSFPEGYFRDPAARAEYGITEVPDPVRPDDRLYFVSTNADGTFESVLKARDQIEGPVWEMIKAKRDALQVAGCKVGNYWFHNDVKSRSQWERMANKVELLGMADTDQYTIAGQSVPWQTMTGENVILTAGLIRQVVDAFEIQEAMIFAAAKAHKTNMLATENPYEYDFSGDWPQVYADTLVGQA